jgi:hypothetical protein
VVTEWFNPPSVAVLETTILVQGIFEATMTVILHWLHLEFLITTVLLRLGA